MKQHAITLAHGTYTELKDTEGAKGTEDKLLWLDIQGTSEELTHFLKERPAVPEAARPVFATVPVGIFRERLCAPQRPGPQNMGAETVRLHHVHPVRAGGHHPLP